MAVDPRYGPCLQIKTVLGCDDEMAEQIRQTLASVMAHRPTRAFLAKACHLAHTTVTLPKKGRGTHNHDDFLINEGKRQVALFMAACAQAQLDLDLFSAPAQSKEHDPDEVAHSSETPQFTSSRAR